MTMDGWRANGSERQASGDADAAPADERLGQALGWASLGLGAAQVLAPGGFDRLIGVKPDERSRAVTVIACGVRELAAAAGILVFERRRPVRSVWARAAGDVLDLALLGKALSSKPGRPDRVIAAIGAVAGITAADLYTALRLSRRSDATPEEKPMHVKAAITVRRPVEDVYGFWRRFENFPRFMYHVESVEVSGDGRSHWKAKAPVGKAEWDAELVEDRPNELIAWRSLEGASVENSGSVRFKPAPGDQGTEIVLELDYAAPGGAVGAAAAKLLGEEPRQQVKDDLRRFKQVMETGEVVRSDASPEGQAAPRLWRQRPAQPPKADADAKREAELERSAS